MDDGARPLRVPPQMSVYADLHDVIHLVQSLVSSLLVKQPDDPISFLLQLLRRTSMDDGAVPPLLFMLPPNSSSQHVEHTEYENHAQKLSVALGAVHVTTESLLEDQSQLSTQARQFTLTEEELLVHLLQQRLKEVDCFNKGWLLEGLPQTRLQALRLQQAGVFPRHVVMLEAPDDVLRGRSQGRCVDPLTGDVYHQSFIWPADESVAQHLIKSPKLSDMQLLAKLQHYRCEVTGVSSAYQHIMKTIDGDQPPVDIYQQALTFTRTQVRYRTPRILLLGPPGSGKNHQARLLAEKYNMVDVSCEELMRSEAGSGSTLGEELQLYLADGQPVPDWLLLQVLDQHLNRLDCSCRGWILHHLPCQPQYARKLKASQHPPNRVYFLELMDAVCLERITLRATDPVTGGRFHAVTRPALNPEVQNRLKTRAEDSVHAVTHTLSMYRTHTASLQCVFPDAIHIDADQDPYSVLEALESRLAAA
ncbi:adenylate kinase 8 [Aulostomus maculatus]